MRWHKSATAVLRDLMYELPTFTYTVLYSTVVVVRVLVRSTFTKHLFQTLGKTQKHTTQGNVSFSCAPSVPEGVSFVAALVVYEESFLSTLRRLPPSPCHVPLFAFDFTVEHIVFLMKYTSSFERIVGDSFKKAGAFISCTLTSIFHDHWLYLVNLVICALSCYSCRLSTAQ